MLALPCEPVMLLFCLTTTVLFTVSESASLQGRVDFSNNTSKHESHRNNNFSKYEFHQSNPKNCGNERPNGCVSWIFESEEYVMYSNRTVFVQSYNLLLNECSYLLQRDKVLICRSRIHDDFETLTIPCGVQVALCISVFSVVLPLFFSMLTEDVRDLVQVNWRGLIMSVFFFHFLLQTVNLDRVSEATEFRYTFPSLMHFFTLVLLSWMTIMSHDGMMMSESSVVADGNSSHMELMRNFRGHLLSIFTAVVLLVTVTLLTEVFGIIPSNFKPLSGDFCWLTQKTLPLFFTGPVLAFNLINFLNFISTYFYFSRQGNCFDGGPLLVLKKNYLVHFKLFVVVDITWLLGVLIFLSELEWLWRIFICVFVVEEMFIVVVPFNRYLEKWVLNKLSGC